MNPITVNTKAFTRELEWCARFIERKTTIPILSNVLLRKSGELLYLTGTDLEIGAQTSIEADGPDFELTVPVHLLLKYLKKVDDLALLLVPNIRLRPTKEGPHIATCEGQGTEGCCEAPEVVSAGLRIQHGDEFATVEIEGMPAESYPCLPSRPLGSIEIGGLEAAIPRACIAICAEESRFTLNGALLDIQGETAQFIATDGHRLSVADAKVFDVEWRLRNAAEPFRALIPKHALTELVRLGDSAFLCRDKDHIFFTVGERTITSRILTGNFPDWERVNDVVMTARPPRTCACFFVPTSEPRASRSAPPAGPPPR
jgi:DNA polymerase III subunit beta